MGVSILALVRVRRLRCSRHRLALSPFRLSGHLLHRPPQHPQTPIRLLIRRHAIAAAVAVGSVAALTALVAASGFRDFGSAFWILNAASIAAVGYALSILAARALDREPGVWKRASAFATAIGGLVAVLAFVRVVELSVAGVRAAVILTGALGATLGMAAVEGLRWVRGGDRYEVL